MWNEGVMYIVERGYVQCEMRALCTLWSEVMYNVE